MSPEETVDALLEASRLPIALSNIDVNPNMNLDEKGQGQLKIHRVLYHAMIVLMTLPLGNFAQLC